MPYRCVGRCSAPAGIHIGINVLQEAMGLQGGGLICRLNYTKSKTAAIAQMGIIVQLSVLAAAIMATEYFIRKRTLPVQ